MLRVVWPLLDPHSSLIPKRLSYGAIGRLARVTPHPGAEFNGYRIPAGVRFTELASYRLLSDKMLIGL